MPGLALAPFSLSIFVVSLLAGRSAGKRRPSRIIQLGFALLLVGIVALLPLIPRARPVFRQASGIGRAPVFWFFAVYCGNFGWRTVSG